MLINIHSSLFSSFKNINLYKSLSTTVSIMLLYPDLFKDTKFNHCLLNTILIPALFFLPIINIYPSQKVTKSIALFTNQANANPAMTGGTDPNIILDHHTDPTQNTSLDNAPNGVEIININTPTVNGISNNYFSDFNVPENGVVLNNSINAGNSQLAGSIYGNPNFNSGEPTASIILNQVTGVGRSNLLGYTEIFGSQAEYILANPNGVTCSGCGFINMSKLSLVSGDAEVLGGNIFFNTNNSSNISINGINNTGGSGLDDSTANSISLISRSLQLAQRLTAQNKLQIITGDNVLLYGTGANDTQVAFANQPTSSSSTTTPVHPTVAIDAYNLGAISAGTINIIATENGVGTRFAPEMLASDSINITANGDITYNSIVATNNIIFNSATNVQNLGTTKDNAGNATFTSALSTVNITYTDSMKNIITKALPSSNNSVLYGNNINILAGNSITNSGLIFAKNNANLSASSITNQYASIYANNDITLGQINTVTNTWIQNTSFTNKIGYVQAQNNVNIYSNTVNNIRNSTLTNSPTGLDTGNPLIPGGSITAEHTFYEEESDPRRSYILAENNLLINSITLNNKGSTIAAANNAIINATNLTNNSDLLKDTTTNYYTAWEYTHTANPDDPACVVSHNCIRVYEWVPHQYDTYSYRQESALFTAGNTLTLNVTNKIDNGQISEYTDYNSIIDQNTYKLAKPITSSTDLSAILSSPGNNLYQINTDPTSHYLLEQRHQFVDINNFYGSDYLWSRLGINYFSPELQGRLVIGDSYFDTQQMSQQILEHTGRQFLNSNQTSDKLQMKQLLDNVVTQNISLNLTVGASLTPAQQAALTSDIIWYVNTTITMPDGSTKEVLTPQLYLCTATKESLTYDATKGSSSITATNINILDPNATNILANNANGTLVVNNTGQIIASQGNMNIVASSINNTGMTANNGIIQATQNSNTSGNTTTSGVLNLVTTKDITNNSGIILSDNSTNLTSIQGSVLSQTLIKTQTLDQTFGKHAQYAYGQDFFQVQGQTAVIASGYRLEQPTVDLNDPTNPINSIDQINTITKTVLIPGMLGQKQTVQVKTLKDPAQGLLAGTNGDTFASSNLHEAKQMGTLVQTNNNSTVNINAKQNLALVGSDIKSTGNTQINTEGSFLATTQTLSDKTTAINAWTGNGGWQQFESTNVTMHTKNIGSNINADNLTVNSGYDLTTHNAVTSQTQTVTNSDGTTTNITTNPSMFIQGSNFNILGITNLNSSGNINILSAKDSVTNINTTVVTESNPWALLGSIMASMLMPGGALVGTAFGMGANYLTQKTTTDVKMSSVETNVASNINSDTLNINAGMELNSSGIATNTAITNNLDINNNQQGNTSIIGSNLTTLNALGITSSGQTNILSSANKNTYVTEHILQQHDLSAMFTAIGAGMASGASTGFVTGAASGAAVGAIAGAGVGALPGAGIGAFFGGIAGAVGGFFSGLVSGFQYMATYTNTTTVKENINVESNINSGGDITLTSNAVNTNPSALPSTINNGNDINIIASNVTTAQTLTANVNGNNLNIESANNTQQTTSIYTKDEPDLGKVAANAAVENAITGSIGGVLSGIAVPIAEGGLFYKFDMFGKTLFTLGKAAGEEGFIAVDIPYLTNILGFGSHTIPLITYPVVTLARGGIADGIGYGLDGYITQNSQGNSGSTDSNQSTVGELNSNVNYNNLILK